MHPLPTPNRFEELDGLRGLAALSVFFSHALNMVTQNALLERVSDSVLHIFWDGAAAVFLFFVLSGFVLALPYVNKDGGPELNYPSYLVRRIFRIFPAYLFAILASLFLMGFVFVAEGLTGLSPWIQSFWKGEVTPAEILRHVTMIGPDTSKIDPPIWTLRIEFIISIFFPLIIYAVASGSSRLTKVVILVGFAVFFARRPSMFFCYLLFLAGALLARYHIQIRRTLESLPKVAIGVLFTVAVVLYSSRFSLGLHKTNSDLGEYLSSLGGALFIVLAISSAALSRILKSAPVQFLGRISYSFYLLHLPILLAASSIIHPATKSLLATWTISLALSFAASVFAFRFVEAPFQRAGKRAAKALTFSHSPRQFIRNRLG